MRLDYEALATAAYEALLEHFEHVEECTCEYDEYGDCWYRYTDDERRQARITAVAAALATEVMENQFV